MPQILQAARDEFLERGYDRASMAGAASRAGVAKGLIYHYFPNKAELLKAVVRSSVQPVLAEVEGHIRAFTGSRAELLQLLITGAYAEVARDRPERLLLKLILGEADRFPELAEVYRTEVLDRELALVRLVLDAGVASGEFRAEVAANPALPAVMIAPLAMSAIWRLMLGPTGAPALHEMRDAHLTLLLCAMAPAPRA